MRIKVFTLPFSSGINGFDDKPAREFLSDKKIVFVREHFFTENNRTYLALVVCYQATIIENQQDKQKKNRNDWKAFIKEENVPLFNSLREWRRERAKSDGVPPYIIFDNLQLAQIANSRPESITEIQAIPRIGQGKAENYGQDIIRIIDATQNLKQKSDVPPDAAGTTQINE
jgi:superfamily II DNA helicase RecQ